MVRRVFSYIQRTEIIKNASILVSGTLFAQAIPILLQPFLRRYFDPAEFGFYSVYVSIIGILLVISSLRFEQAIVLPQKDSDAISLVNISVIISVVFNLFILSFIIIFNNQLLQLLSLPNSRKYILYLIPLGTFLLSIFQIFNFWLIRKKRFKAISLNKLSRRSVEGVSQSIFALTGKSGGLIFGDIAGQLANGIVSVFQSLKSGYSIAKISSGDLKRLLKRYIDFPKYSLVPALMSTVCFMLPVVFINRYYSAEYAGYFDLTKLILSVPLALIASSFSSVVLNKTSECYREKKGYFKEIKPLIGIVVLISAIELVVILFWSESLFTFIFGSKWKFSGSLAKILVFPFALNFLTSSFTSLFVALNKIVWQSIWQIFYFALILVLPLLSGLKFENFIFAYSAIEVIANSSMVVLLILLIKKTNGKN